ncbi:MAG TPA: ROK family protein [Patescibacteria group bacterium]|nr:ROK family protein [Patescibacteria group bacterium]
MVQPEFTPIGTAEPFIIAVDNGGTNTRVEARLGNQRLGDMVDYGTPHNYDTAVATLAEAATSLAQTEDRPIDAIGFAVAGEISQDGDRLVRAGELNDYGWVLRPFQTDIANAIGLEAGRVVLLNDCVAAAKAQQVHNQRIRSDLYAYVSAISTGFGGAGFDGNRLIADEPGHEFLRSGAICGCGQDGCAEAHISGSGIERNRGIRAENLPAAQWEEVTADAVDAYAQLLKRLDEQFDLTPKTLYYFGSVAVNAPGLLAGISKGLLARRYELPILPNIAFATHGEDSGIVGAGDAAIELIAA